MEHNNKILILVLALGLSAGSLHAQCTGGTDGHTCVIPTTPTPTCQTIRDTINQTARDGDTVQLPAVSIVCTGNATQADGQIAINKAITLKGQTTVTFAGDGTATAVDSTTITRQFANTAGLIDLNTITPASGAKLMRITGITFRQALGVVGSSVGTPGGYIGINGFGLARVDNCHIVYTGGGTGPAAAGIAQGFRWGNGSRGLVDHNFIESDGTQVFYLENGDGTASNVIRGNYAWSKGNRAAQDLTYGWGSRDFAFFEDNYIKCGINQRALTDGSSGCKFVVRHNTIVNARIATHGTESQNRGGRAVEVYLNKWLISGNWFNNQGDVGGTREGGVMFWGNNYNYLGGGGFRLASFRTGVTYSNCLAGAPANQCVWGGGGGWSPWDVNETEGKAQHDGYQTGDERPVGPNFTGGNYNEANHLNPWQYWPLKARANNFAATPPSSMPSTWKATAGSLAGFTTGQYCAGNCPAPTPANNYTRIVNDTDPHWLTGTFGSEWNGFAVTNLGGASSTVADGHHNQIGDIQNQVSNSVSFITTARNTDKTKPENTYAPGVKYAIFKVLATIDQPGRGAGDLITGALYHFVNSTTGTMYWPHNVIDPCYSWLNRGPGNVHMDFEAGGYTTIHQNNEWYGESTAANPNPVTTGVRVGPKSALPAFGGSVTGVSGYDIAHCTPTLADYAVSGMGDAGVPGTAYWATDVDSINGSSDRGALYVWYKPISGGVPGTPGWNLWYQPYEYPHPCSKQPNYYAANGSVASPAQCAEGAVATPIITTTAVTFTVGVNGPSVTLGTQGFSPAPTTWTRPSGTLPSGISFNTALNTPVNGLPGGTFSGTPASGTAGTYAQTVTASNGTQTSAATTVSLTVKNPGPTVSITSDASSPTSATTVTITATATPVSPATISKVQFFDSDVLLGTDLTSPYTWAQTYSAGQHSITAVATDSTGATGTSDVLTFSVSSTNPVSVSISAPSNGANIPNTSNPVTISASASTSTPGATISSVQFFVDGTALTPVDNTAPYSYSTTLAVGPRVLKAQATDSNGVSQISSEVNVTVTSPTGPTAAPIIVKP